MQIEELRANKERLNLTKKDLALIEHDFANARDDVIRWIRHIGESFLFWDSEVAKFFKYSKSLDSLFIHFLT